MKIIYQLLLSLCFGLMTSSLFALANPASVNCVKHGYKLILMKSTGICLFKDGTYCEEWAYFRKTCKVGQQKLPKKFDANHANQYCVVKIGNKPTIRKCKN